MGAEERRSTRQARSRTRRRRRDQTGGSFPPLAHPCESADRDGDGNIETRQHLCEK